MATPANDIWEQVKAIKAENARLRGELAAAEKERDELLAEVERLKARLQYAARHNEAQRAENERLRAEPERLRAAMMAVSEEELAGIIGEELCSTKHRAKPWSRAGNAVRDRLLAECDKPAEPQTVADADPVDAPDESPQWPPIMVERQPHQTLIDKARLAELEADAAYAKEIRADLAKIEGWCPTPEAAADAATQQEKK